MNSFTGPTIFGFLSFAFSAHRSIGLWPSCRELSDSHPAVRASAPRPRRMTTDRQGQGAGATLGYHDSLRNPGLDAAAGGDSPHSAHLLHAPVLWLADRVIDVLFVACFRILRVRRIAPEMLLSFNRVLPWIRIAMCFEGLLVKGRLSLV